MSELSIEQKVAVKNLHWKVSEMIANERKAFHKEHPELNTEWRLTVDVFLEGQKVHSGQTESTKE